MRTLSSVVLPVIAIGASAGGLGACAQLLDALPYNLEAAFVVVQHLDPSHENMLVELLSSHTSMSVREAHEGMSVEAGHVYVIRPGNFLSIRNGHLSVTPPIPPQLARWPFDLFLSSLAADSGDKAICVVLSGTGADGMAGVREIKRNGGYIIVQEPHEAAFSGMPESAIATGAVNAVLPISQIPAALVAQLGHIERGTQRAVAYVVSDCARCTRILIYFTQGGRLKSYPSDEGTMRTAEECQSEAERCERNALTAQNEILRATLTSLAVTWRRLGRTQRRKTVNPDHHHGESATSSRHP